MPRRTNMEGPRRCDRRQEVVLIAYRHIAERGFEGLRVREVAREAGMNHATLLHYFPSKEALIQAVVEYLLQRFSTPRGPHPDSAIGQFAAEFDDLRAQLREDPAMFVVLTELQIRARRDSAIVRLLGYLYDGWRGHLCGIIRRGIAEGAFRPDLDPALIATAIMAQTKGIAIQAMVETDPEVVDRLITEIAAQVQHWIAGEGTAGGR